MNVQSVSITNTPYYGGRKEELANASLELEVKPRVAEEENGGVVFERSSTENVLASTAVKAAATPTTDKRKLQSYLSALGFYKGPIDGNFSSDLSKKAVKNFQTVYGIKADGNLNKKTMDKLNEVNTMYSKVLNSSELSKLASSSLWLDRVEKDNLAKVWTFFRVGMGLTTNQTAGICGNLHGESRFSTDNAQKITDKDTGKKKYQSDHDSDYKFDAEDEIGYGLEQWTDESVKKVLQKTAKDMGLSVSDLNAQLATFRKEITSTRKDYWSKALAKSSYRDVSDKFLENVENPKIKNYAERREYSKKIYDALKSF